ncbi:hypothetical protein GCM10008106_28740 [Mongoliitalea lutea]|uniref:Uncharacterized protein n=2 Tax=Mongoliitalea lutea TaxID=849756 RepID=A0A8J3CYU4_9BACT|nr:hypothetical protein GCM10008106_28740 [Mongoliitalea lutea]
MVLTVTSYGQSLDQEKLNSYFDALVNADKMMGAAMMVKDGNISKPRGWKINWKSNGSTFFSSYL